MVNEVVASVIVAGRTEAALRAAAERQLIVADRSPTRDFWRPRWSGRSLWPIRGRPSGTAAAG
jgi:hypothetical protein